MYATSYKLAIKNEKIPTFSEVCKRVAPGNGKPKSDQKQILRDMTRCQNLRCTKQSYASSTMTDSGSLSWIEQKEMPRCPRSTITCGMLPTLRALASKECENSQGTICLVPFDANMDSASHLQIILLEAYCRETGIKVLRVSRERIRDHLCPGSGDLSCVLISNDDPYFLDTPE